MSEFIKNNPYAELEAENFEKRLRDFENQNEAEPATELDNSFEDPRLKATEAQASFVGFSLKNGQYIDLIQG